MTSLLNLNQLRVFHFAAKYGKIGVAAEKLMVTQPAVSMQVKALEEQHETQLFKKVHKRLELTETGLRLYKITERIFDLVQEADGILAKAKGFPINVLNVGVSKTFFHSHLIPFISRYQAVFPDTQIHINEGHSQEMVNSVLQDRNELAIVGRVRYPHKIEFIHLFGGELFLIVPVGHRLCGRKHISIEDLATETLILKEKGSGTRMLIQKALEEKGLFPRVTIETGNDECIGEMVKEGSGITLMARESLNQEIKNGHLISIPLQDENLIVPIDIIFKRGKTLSSTAKSFIDLLNEELGESKEGLKPP